MFIWVIEIAMGCNALCGTLFPPKLKKPDVTPVTSCRPPSYTPSRVKSIQDITRGCQHLTTPSSHLSLLLSFFNVPRHYDRSRPFSIGSERTIYIVGWNINRHSACLSFSAPHGLHVVPETGTQHSLREDMNWVVQLEISGLFVCVNMPDNIVW